MDALKKFYQEFVSDVRASVEKLPSWLLPILIGLGLVFIVAALSKGFTVWLLVILILWYLILSKGLAWLIGKSIYAVYGFVLVVIVSSAYVVNSADSGNSSASNNNSNTSVGQTSQYSITGGDGITAGWAEAEILSDGRVTVDYVIVIDDSSIKNNGKCIDNGGDWCSNDPDGLHARIEAIKYHYGLTFKNTEGSETVAATTLWPVYCNAELLRANPQNFKSSIAYDQKPDLTCNGKIVATWQPTSTFTARSTTTFESLEKFLTATELGLYDISSTYTITETSDATSQTISEGNSLSTNEYHTQTSVKTYTISIN